MNIIEVNIELSKGLSDHETDRFLDDFLSKAIEANSLQFGGMLNHGYIEPDGIFEVGEIHKQKVVAWLDKQEYVKSHELQLINDVEIEVELFPLRPEDGC